jgi:uncharacterized cupredoxin-like copper-binding protein
MKARILMLAALALTAIAVYAHDGEHQGMMSGMRHGKSEGAHAQDVGHADGIGKPGNPNKVSRAIQVVMSDDMKFTPANIDVRRGETIEFVVRNAGSIKHEMVIGTMAELKQHAALMRRFPGMEHSDPNMITLAPGKSGVLVWQFTQAGRFDFACLQPGHFEAGMVGAVSVK